MSKREMTYDFALGVARVVKVRLGPVCDKIEIAGSIRRKKDRVGDIEIVAVSKMGPPPTPTGLFPQDEPLLLLLLDELEKEGKLQKVKGGTKARQYIITVVPERPQLDLFIVQPDAWGFQLAIRTGPWQYSRWLVTQRNKGGGMTDSVFCRKGDLWIQATRSQIGGQGRREWIDGICYAPYPVETEQDFFKLIKGGWVPPEQRKRPTEGQSNADSEVHPEQPDD